MRRGYGFVVLWFCLSSWTGAVGVGAETRNLRILFLARDDATRTESFEKFLKEHFTQVSVVAREEFQAEQAKGFDVAILDWPQSERLAGRYESPLGSLEDWDTPLVLLGSAGLQMAGPWNVIGGAG